MAKETQGDKDKRLLAMLLKNVREETLRQWTEVYAAENAEFCQKTLAYLRQHCMPEMGEPDEWREKVDEIFEAERPGHRYRYSSVQPDWEKIGAEMEKLFDLLSLMEGKESFRIIHAAVSEFFRQVDDKYTDDFLYEGSACVADAEAKGEELLLKALRSDEASLEWKREVLEDMEEISEFAMFCEGDYFAMESFLEQVALVVLPDTEALERLEEKIAEEPAWSATPYLLEKERLLRKMGRAEEAEQFLLRHLDDSAMRQERVERLMAAGRYEEGMALIEEMLPPKSGSHTTWLHLQCRYAEEYKDIPRLLKGYRTLFWEYRGDVESYRRLKQLLPREQWDATLTEMLDEVRREQGLNCHALADICVEERLYGRIPDFLPPDEAERMRFICRYAPLMPQPAALMKIFPRASRAYAKTKPDRVHYTILAECLKNIRSVEGGRDISEKLVAEFREQYRRRSAMMQELDKCGL